MTTCFTCFTTPVIFFEVWANITCCFSLMIDGEGLEVLRDSGCACNAHLCCVKVIQESKHGNCSVWVKRCEKGCLMGVSCCWNGFYSSRSEVWCFSLLLQGDDFRSNGGHEEGQESGEWFSRASGRMGKHGMMDWTKAALSEKLF